jgi:hypothetical protein
MFFNRDRTLGDNRCWTRNRISYEPDSPADVVLRVTDTNTDFTRMEFNWEKIDLRL